jgi:hypothetical protein
VRIILALAYTHRWRRIDTFRNAVELRSSPSAFNREAWWRQPWIATRPCRRCPCLRNLSEASRAPLWPRPVQLVPARARVRQPGLVGLVLHLRSPEGSRPPGTCPANTTNASLRLPAVSCTLLSGGCLEGHCLFRESAGGRLAGSPQRKQCIPVEHAWSAATVGSEICWAVVPTGRHGVLTALDKDWRELRAPPRFPAPAPRTQPPQEL